MVYLSIYIGYPKKQQRAKAVSQIESKQIKFIEYNFDSLKI